MAKEGKRPFLVSGMQEFVSDEGDAPCYADTFVAHLFDMAGSRRDGDKIYPPFCSTVSEYSKLYEQVRSRHARYLEVLAPRLNAVNQVDYSKDFWSRSLGMHFERLISGLYQAFLTFEYYFDISIHARKILSIASRYTPVDPDELRWFLEHRPFGREQFFAEYIDEFYPGALNEQNIQYKSDYQVRQIRGYTGRDPTVGIMGAWFSEEASQRLLRESGGQVDFIGFNRLVIEATDRLELSKRLELSQSFPKADRFDRYFFRCLKTLLPKFFVEDFKQHCDSIMSQFSDVKNLKYIVSEIWIGEGVEPVAAALLKEQRSVELIYNEHNYVEYPAAVSFSPRWAQLCDVYAAHGTYADKIGQNAVSTGLLYDFLSKETLPLEDPCFDVAYFAVLNFPYDAELTGSTIQSGFGQFAKGKQTFEKSFFEHLSRPTKERMHYRGYPNSAYGKYWESAYRTEELLKDSLSGVEIADFNLSGQETMARASLVVLGYFGTSTLEAFKINVPTVILIYRFDEVFEHIQSSHLDSLRRQGIIQSDPAAAAHFVESILDDPRAWWESTEVQGAKDEFVQHHTGDPERMIQFLLQTAETGEVDFKRWR